MFRVPHLELRVVVRRRGQPGGFGPDRIVGLRSRQDPWRRRKRIWQWVVEIDADVPALRDTLANSQGFLVDDDCGRTVGMVENACQHHDLERASGRLVVQGWGRQRISVPFHDVLEVAPGRQRLVIACLAGHVTAR